MTQKEKLIKAFMTVQSCKHTAKNIVTDCSKYSSTATSYAKDIISICDDFLKVIKSK